MAKSRDDRNGKTTDPVDSVDEVDAADLDGTDEDTAIDPAADGPEPTKVALEPDAGDAGAVAPGDDAADHDADDPDEEDAEEEDADEEEEYESDAEDDEESAELDEDDDVDDDAELDEDDDANDDAAELDEDEDAAELDEADDVDDEEAEAEDQDEEADAEESDDSEAPAAGGRRKGKRKPTDDDGVSFLLNRRQRLAEAERQAKRQALWRNLRLAGLCVLAALAVLAYPLYMIIDGALLQNTPRRAWGVAAANAGCRPIEKLPSQVWQQLPDAQRYPDYPRLPPDSGPYASSTGVRKNFYTAADRPAVETLVGFLAAGDIVAWYNADRIGGGEVRALQGIGNSFAPTDPTRYIAAPWTSADSVGGFPDGVNVIYTRWSAEIDPATRQPKNPQAIRLACERVSGETVDNFAREFPSSNAINPGG